MHQLIRPSLNYAAGDRELSKQTAQMRIGYGQTGAALVERRLENYIARIDRPDIDRFKPLEARLAF